MPSNYLILCRPPLLLPSIFPSIRVFSNESTLRIRWPKYWSFSFNISPSNEHPGPVSFRMDWLDLLAVQGTLKSLLQHHSSKASILQCSAFFMVQISHPYMTTGKTIALIKWTFVGKVMSLLFNMMSRLVISISLYVLLNFLNFSIFNAIFKGYFPFTVITKYWLYLPYCATHPQAWFTPVAGASCSPIPVSPSNSPLLWKATSLLSTPASLLLFCCKFLDCSCKWYHTVFFFSDLFS